MVEDTIEVELGDLVQDQGVELVVAVEEGVALVMVVEQGVKLVAAVEQGVDLEPGVILVLRNGNGVLHKTAQIPPLL